MGDAAALPDHGVRRATPPAPAPDGRRRDRRQLTPQDWLQAFAEIGERIRAAVAPAAGTEAGRREISTGAGGDRTVELDRLAEEAALQVFERLHRQGARFSLLSEELGKRDFGAPLPLVLMDPVDGSVNAKQGIPLYAAMLSLCDGPSVGDVSAGHVLNLVSGECWQAERGGGAWRDGRPITVLPPARAGRIDVLGLE
ncbi:MAG TPA: inositol monophosphatase family protein, partial [Candidatus Acidoferrales bacterium]|nr:inositol monophosphatase family protein [Candidatus Acidoferrales bacterium]